MGCEPRIAYPEVKVQVRDLVRVVGIVAPLVPVGIVAPLSHWGWVRGKNSFYRAPGGVGPGDVYRVPPAAVRHGRATQISGTGPYGNYRKILWVTGPRGQHSEKSRFIENPGIQ